MAITTTTELKTAIANWSNRSDLTSRLEEFISIFEASFNRNVRVKGMEATMTTTALSSGAASLPTAFLAFKELRFDGAIDHTLQPKSLEWIRAQDQDAGGDPLYFAITSSQVVCWPATGSIKGTYYRSLPSLTGTASNWLLSAHPDIYLFGALTELAIYIQDEQRASMWRDRTRAMLDELERADAGDDFDGGVLAIRAR
jgi:hypothetical protein